MDYNTVVIVNGFQMEIFCVVLEFMFLFLFWISILVILGGRNDVLRNIRFNPNKSE
jgi:hypothetical protein